MKPGEISFPQWLSTKAGFYGKPNIMLKNIPIYQVPMLSQKN